MKSSIVLLSALAGAASAKHCINATVPVTIAARNAIFNVEVPQVDADVPALTYNLTKQGQNFTGLSTLGYYTNNKTYQISTKFCVPDAGLTANTIAQVLIHGIGFDKTYWDLAYNNYNYSYINAATNASFATLSYDRLGIGNSSHGEPLNEIQAASEVAVAAQLTRMLRSGSFPGANHTFTKVVHVGHSFGSGQTFALANAYPALTDGIVLTGFSTNGTFLSDFVAGAAFVQANTFNATRFGNLTASSQNLPNGYLITGTPGADAYLFALAKHVDPALLKIAGDTKQPVTVGELLTVSSLPAPNAYSGPVLIVTGSADIPFCGGDCLATGNASLASIPAAAMKAFPNVAASNFTAYIQPNTGHGINIHYNSTGAYKFISSWLSSKGLSSV